MLRDAVRLIIRLRSQVFQPQTSTFASALYAQGYKRQDQRYEYNKREDFSWNANAFRIGAPLFALSWMITLKDLLGIEKIQLDKDPIKEKIKKSWLDRKFRKYDSAIQVLEIALEEVKEKGEELPITRVLDEIANTYYEKGDLEKAEEYFKIVIDRLLRLHGFRDSSPQFIGISLKLAEIFASLGRLDAAESGFKHCVRKQMQVNYRGDDRVAEACEYMDEVLKISYQIFGATAFHTANLLNNFGAVCILANRFELARKYLEIGIDRIININEAASIIPGYYCNYAEALWHCGRLEEALKYAKDAVNFSKSEEPRTQKYCNEFLKSLQKDFNKGKGWSFW